MKALPSMQRCIHCPFSLDFDMLHLQLACSILFKCKPVENCIHTHTHKHEKTMSILLCILSQNSTHPRFYLKDRIIILRSSIWILQTFHLHTIENTELKIIVWIDFYCKRKNICIRLFSFLLKSCFTIGLTENLHTCWL